jgi:hypothetical protein
MRSNEQLTNNDTLSHCKENQTQRISLQTSATQWKTLQCITPHRIASQTSVFQSKATQCSAKQYIATQCNAMHCPLPSPASKIERQSF